MGHRSRVTVLLVCEKPQEFFGYRQLFDRNDCQCQYAKSHLEVTRLPNLQELDIVLSSLRIPGESVRALIASFSGSRASVFCSLRLEQSYWWLPVLRLGKECFGTTAFRPGDFVPVFEHLVREIRASMAPLP
jgi:hypothetical protein